MLVTHNTIMFILVIYTLLAVLLATGVQLFLQLRVQIEAAKKTGLKYVILRKFRSPLLIISLLSTLLELQELI